MQIKYNNIASSLSVKRIDAIRFDSRTETLEISIHETQSEEPAHHSAGSLLSRAGPPRASETVSRGPHFGFL